MQKERLELLQGMPIFGGVKGSVLELLLSVGGHVSVEPGGYFMHEGEDGQSMFILLVGKAAILKTWEGREYLLRYSNPGDCFGEMSLIDLGPRSASVRAVIDAEALEITTNDLHRVYETDREQFALLHMNMGREVSRRLRLSNQHLFEAKIEAGKVGEDLHLF